MPIATTTRGSTKTFLNQWSTRQMRRCARHREIGAGASTAAASGSGVRSFMVGHRRRAAWGPTLPVGGLQSGLDRVVAMARMSGTGSKPVAVAAFDFDGTLSRRDNFVPFLHRFAGSPALAGAFATGALRVARAGRAHWSRNGMKAEVLQQLLAGRDVADLDDPARVFAADVIARHLRAEALERADWHRTQGHRLVMVSASLAV